MCCIAVFQRHQIRLTYTVYVSDSCFVKTTAPDSAPDISNEHNYGYERSGYDKLRLTADHYSKLHDATILRSISLNLD